MVGVGRLALPRLFGFEPNRSAIPGEPHAGSPSRSSTNEGWSATRDLHPEGAAILSRRGLLFPLRPVAVKWCRVKDSHPQPSRSERDASAVGLTRQLNAAVERGTRNVERPAAIPHSEFCNPRLNWRIRQDSHLQTLRSKRRMIVVSPRMRKWWVASESHRVLAG